MTAAAVHHGSCLCGAVAFTIEGPLAPIQVCHCSQCRKAQGGPFATNIPVETARLRFRSGEAGLARYESSPGKIRTFCPTCASPVFSARTALPGVVRIRAGLLDEPVASRPAFHQQVASASSWWPISDDLPRYPAGPEARAVATGIDADPGAGLRPGPRPGKAPDADADADQA